MDISPEFHPQKPLPDPATAPVDVPDAVLNSSVPAFARMIRQSQRAGFYPFFHAVKWSSGAEVKVGGHRLLMIGANDYLGLSREPEVIEAAVSAAREYGTGHGGSRFLCGNTPLHEELEAKIAAWVGKKGALLHATGYQANVGILGAFGGMVDWILGDHENHASLLEGARASGLKQMTYRPQDPESAASRFRSIRERQPGGRTAIVTDSLFSMSGEMAPLQELASLKGEADGTLLFVDEAHALGVLGPEGRGAAVGAGITAETDFIMGTFSKALASIGGFVASDDEDMLLYMKHHSKSLIFSAALPAMNVAAAGKALELLQTQPERLDRLHEVVRRVRAGYRRMGIPLPKAETPILPIPIGDEIKACQVARGLFERGVFAMPALYPAVPRGQAMLRTAYMSIHTDAQLDRILETLEDVFREEDVSCGMEAETLECVDAAGR